MSTPIDWRRVVRVVAAEDAGVKSVHETVNVITTKAGDVHNSIKEHTQITAAQYNAQSPHTRTQIDTLIDSGVSTQKPPLRTIYINGYTGPS